MKKSSRMIVLLTLTMAVGCTDRVDRFWSGPGSIPRKATTQSVDTLADTLLTVPTGNPANAPFSSVGVTERYDVKPDSTKAGVMESVTSDAAVGTTNPATRPPHNGKATPDPGESMTHFAQRFGLSVPEFCAMNNICHHALLRKHQAYWVIPNTAMNGYVTHVVEHPYEDVRWVARVHQVKSPQVLQWNSLAPTDSLRSHQSIRLYLYPRWIQSREGDTLLTYARQFGTPFATLVAWNRAVIHDPDLMPTGKWVRVQ